MKRITRSQKSHSTSQRVDISRLNYLIDLCTVWLIFKLMVGIPNKQSSIKPLLLFLIFIQIATGSITVLPSNRNIGQLATYTLTITFSGSSPYNTLTITFPSETSLASASIMIDNSTPAAGILGNVISITQPLTSNPLTITVSNVRNPYSAISTRNFIYLSPGGSDMLAIPGITYQGGNFTSCPWTFSLCTEQQSSELTIPITLTNNLNIGTYYFLIGYQSTWANLNTKNLVSGNTGLTCFYSVNNGSFIQGTSCLVDSSNPRINFLFNAATNLTSGSNIVVKVSGVNSPPTKTTYTNTNFYIKTTDNTLSFNIIDQASSCTINPVCVMSQTLGNLKNTTLIINGNYGNPEIIFPTRPFSVTVMASDVIQVSFSPFSSLSSCSKLYFLRAGSNTYTMEVPIINSPIMTFTVPNSAITNNQYLSNITLAFECSAFKLPPSETPTVLSFLFKRSNSEYMQLTHTVNALARQFNFSRAVTLSDTSMISNTSVYSFNFLIGQPLGTTPMIDLTFPALFIITSPTCNVTIVGVSVTSGLCTKNGTSNKLSVPFTVPGILAAGTNITISIIGITNPNSPGIYPIEAKSYYTSAQSTSLVEYSTTAFIATVTQISNFPMFLSPSNLTVYSKINLTITFTNTIAIPADSLFTVSLPVGVSSISSPSNLLSISGATKPFTIISINQTTLKVSFTTGLQIQVGSPVAINIQIKTPTTMGPFSFVKVVISNGATRYISSQNSLYLDVNSVNSLTMNINALDPTAGATTNYQFTLNLNIPHDLYFIAEVTVPTDTKYFTSNTSCVSGCNTTSVSATSTFFSVIVKNVGGLKSTLASFTVSSFLNPRSVEPSMQWTISTKSISSNSLISTTYSRAQITIPNVLTASLSKDDMYTKYNSRPVKINFKFTNLLKAGDYIILSMTPDIYSATTVTCSSIYGICSLIGSTNVTVVKIIANTTSISNGSLLVIVQGLTSGISNYLVNYKITATSYTSLGKQMDTGEFVYNLTCRAQFAKNCKECYGNGSCYSCYLNEGYYLLGDTCFSSCGNVSSYMSYANNSTGTCSTCINNCATCDTSTFCKTCSSNYFLYPDATCKFSCQTSMGYFNSTQGPVKMCSYCVSNCLQCVNASSSCTRCNNLTLLQNGLCVSGCISDSSYQSNGQCFPCHKYCLTCRGEGSGNCISCSTDSYRYNTLCVAACPNGTAIHPVTQVCSCDPKCLTCSGYTYCTACANTTDWAMNGNCVDKCPDGTFENSAQCSPCDQGCLICTINTCTQCVNSSRLFNNKCYSDCNLISQQYDALGISCVLCPNGCDSCTGTLCTTCLPDFTLTGTQCIETCLLDDSCNLGKQVLPMPGLITIFVWAIICAVVYFIYGKNYLPYSVVLLSSLVQLIQVIALLSSLNSSTVRLLASSSTSTTPQIKGLLIGTLLVNYLLNIAYIVVFIKYIKPLITNPRQIDIISNIVVLVIGTATNFRFGLIAFAKMFPKPNIYIENQSKLTPVHYLCFAAMLFDILPIIACGMGVLNQNPLSTPYMLSIDILIIIILNIVFTIWMIASKKPDHYFQNDIKKYQIQDGIQNTTNEALPNEKNYSKANMVANESFNTEDIEQTQFDINSFKRQGFNKGESMNVFDKQSKTNSQILKNQKVKPITIKTSRKNDLGDPDPFLDPNFETNLKSKKSEKLKDSSIIISKFNMGNPSDKDGKSMDDNLSMKKGQVISKNMGKGTIKTDRKNNSPKKNIPEISETQNADLEVEQTKRQANGTVFGTDNAKIAKPKRVSQNKALNKSIDQPMKVMKKGDKKIGYFESDAYESNADNDDIEQIIKQKIWQSTVKLQRHSQQFHRQSTEQVANQEISPSWFNIQNQRLQLQDFEEDSDPQ